MIGAPTGRRPGETPQQQADRNLTELLQELRVVQTGVQILFAFLLTLPFQSRFESTAAWQGALLVSALLCAALASVFLIAPVAYHRILFRQGRRPSLVAVANASALVGLGLLGVAVVLALFLVVSYVVGVAAAWWLAGLVLVVLLVVWVALPAATRLRE